MNVRIGLMFMLIAGLAVCGKPTVPVPARMGSARAVSSRGGTGQVAAAESRADYLLHVAVETETVFLRPGAVGASQRQSESTGGAVFRLVYNANDTAEPVGLFHDHGVEAAVIPAVAAPGCSDIAGLFYSRMPCDVPFSADVMFVARSDGRYYIVTRQGGLSPDGRVRCFVRELQCP